MPDTASEAFETLLAVAGWLQPLDGEPCGPALEYEADFLELAQLAAGKPETQFGPAEQPDWARVRELSESLLPRTRDLRIAVWWSRARLNLDGFAALPELLSLQCGLLERFWDNLYPLPDPDDGDTFARLSAIGGLDKVDNLLGDVRNALLSDDPRLGGLRMRELEIALEKLAPRPEDKARSRGQIAGMIADAPEIAEALRAQSNAAVHWLNKLHTLMGKRFSLDMGVDLKTLRGMLAALQAVLPADASAAAAAAEPPSPEAGTGASAALKPIRASGVYSVESRSEAVRAIELVCAYLERHEPTNPAQLLLHRAARVIDKNFLQLVRDLAPDAVKDVARIMGVDPATIKDQN